MSWNEIRRAKKERVQFVMCVGVGKGQKHLILTMKMEMEQPFGFGVWSVWKRVEDI